MTCAGNRSLSRFPYSHSHNRRLPHWLHIFPRISCRASRLRPVVTPFLRKNWHASATAQPTRPRTPLLKSYSPPNLMLLSRRFPVETATLFPCQKRSRPFLNVV